MIRIKVKRELCTSIYKIRNKIRKNLYKYDKRIKKVL